MTARCPKGGRTLTAIYTRQSVERADSISVEQQAALCREALTAREAQTCRVYTDKGFSGKNTDRPALQRLLADAEAGRIDRLLVYRLDRISRSVHDFTELCARLGACGVHFQSITEGLTLDDSPTGTVMAQIMMVFAQFERETIQRRVTDNYFARAKAGLYLGGVPPFGFTKGETTVGGKRTACYVPDPPRAALVAGLFTRYLREGETLGSLVRHLNGAGVPAARGGSWSTLPLGRLLRNPAFVRADAAVYRYLRAQGATMNDPAAAYDGQRGCYCYAPRGTRHGVQATGCFVTLAPHEGLVDAAVWLAVQRKLARNRALGRSGAGTHSWLSGLMKCEKCGYAITVVAKANGAGGHYINCGGRKRGAAVCEGRREVVTLEQIEQSVQPYLLDWLASYRGVRAEVVRPPSAEQNRLAAQIAAHEQQIDGLTRSLARIREADVIDRVAAQIHAENTALTALRQQHAALCRREAADALEPCYRAILAEWQDYTIEEKKRLARAVLRRVVVGDGTLRVVFRLPYGGGV